MLSLLIVLKIFILSTTSPSFFISIKSSCEIYCNNFSGHCGQPLSDLDGVCLFKFESKFNLNYKKGEEWSWFVLALLILL